ncbi:FtsK/SpoIIIE family DNA translocase [Desertibacillus haloalkaliphilus]|uniref:FtsK/SpoIIIE family DNA translocase n=1 Tax=Desertibacillus haloalkaliphilus TaxID=1328930 RepID=UPI001C28134C|nr:DNA translocase FtsK [Desertibacillus haloalkaliphilus]MBU8907356.1 DNA translocase FtsK [Desertibacillus haloalkaliphilus]
MARKKKKQKIEWKKQLKFELFGLSLFVLSIVTFAQLGSVGDVLVYLFRFFIGDWHIACTVAIFLISMYLIIKRKVPNLWTRRLGGMYLLLLSFVLMSHVTLFEQLAGQTGFEDSSVIRNTWELYWLSITGENTLNTLGGGMVGAIGFAVSYFLFAELGTWLVAWVLVVISVILITGRSLGELTGSFFVKMLAIIKNAQEKLKSDFQDWKTNVTNEIRKRQEKQKQKLESPVTSEEAQNVSVDEPSEPIIHDFSSHGTPPPIERAKEITPVQDQQGDPSNDGEDQSEIKGQTVEEEIGEQDTSTPLITAEFTNADYQLPPADLLHLPNKNGQQQERQQVSANARKLERTLESFGVKARVSQVHLGPAVTKYEVHPNIGVKVSKIVNLSDDLALALAAKDIRIEAPIPGKSAIGIEVPNQEVALVSLKEVLDTSEKQNSSVLSVALGRDISGEPILASLNKMPHLLVAGATGSGKSVCINGIITSILMKAMPHEVKLMMIDPKMVELNVYNGVPHLLTPVVTEPKKASQALKKVVSEMERRYDLFSHTGTRNIEGYNELIKRQNNENEEQQATLPYIVVIVDELADLMMVASGDVEDSITRLAQMARAAGIHMIIATQRPSVDVITGVIKANIPSRIAFGVSSQTDSRTILDTGGAEKLLGRGDMLYLPVGASKPTRIQGAFLSDEEVERVVDFVISQQKAQYQEEMTPTEVKESEQEVSDEIYPDAVELVMEMNTASVSMLQRRFRIGYTRAARLIDEMEARGIVGPYEGSKPREVLVDKPTTEEASS